MAPPSPAGQRLCKWVSSAVASPRGTLISCFLWVPSPGGPLPAPALWSQQSQGPGEGRWPGLRVPVPALRGEAAVPRVSPGPGEGRGRETGCPSYAGRCPLEKHVFGGVTSAQVPGDGQSRAALAWTLLLLTTQLLLLTTWGPRAQAQGQRPVPGAWILHHHPKLQGWARPCPGPPPPEAQLRSSS